MCIRDRDKLIPVITITVYLGTKEWDGPRKLSDMFGDVDEELMPVSYTHLDVYKRQNQQYA